MNYRVLGMLLMVAFKWVLPLSVAKLNLDIPIPPHTSLRDTHKVFVLPSNQTLQHSCRLPESLIWTCHF